MKSIFFICAIAIRELVYERVFYLLLCFAVVCLGLSVLLGQLTYAEQYKLTIDFLLSTIHLSMILFSVFMGISLFQREIVSGSVSMVLSKPIARSSFLLGKFLGQSVVQLIVVALMTAGTVATLAQYPDVKYLPIIQATALLYLETLVLTAMAFLFSVVAGAITASVAVFCLFALSHLQDSIPMTAIKGWMATLWSTTRFFLPELGVFNIKSLASYGVGISPETFGWAVVYAVCCAGFYLCAACVCFSKRDIIT